MALPGGIHPEDSTKDPIFDRLHTVKIHLPPLDMKDLINDLERAHQEDKILWKCNNCDAGGYFQLTLKKLEDFDDYPFFKVFFLFHLNVRI